VTLNSIDWLSSRTVPVAVISQEPFLGQLHWPLLYSLFAPLKSPALAKSLLEISLSVGGVPAAANPKKFTIFNNHQ
jgi:hypothetical protein